MPLPKRKPNRLKQYDYSRSGAYFITICVKDRQKVFWAITRAHGDDVPGQLSQQGLAVEKELRHIGEIYGNAVAVDKYVIMPNHVHLIVFLQPDSEQAKPIHSIAHIINQFKGAVTKQIGASVWQRSYHDRIIRNEREYERIWAYIDTNVASWEMDCYYM